MTRPSYSEGVYSQHNPTTRPSDEEMGVPRYLSGPFFRFFFEFLRNPTLNATFLREIRQLGNRWRMRSKTRLIVVVLLATLVMTVLLLALIPAQQSYEQSIMAGRLANPFIKLAFLVGTLGAGLTGLLKSNGYAQRISVGPEQEELALTLLRPLQIVWGYLTAGCVPYLIIPMIFTPGICFLVLDEVVTDPHGALQAIPALSGAVVFGLYIGSVALLSSAIGCCLSYRIEGFVEYGRAYIAWIFAMVFYLTPGWLWAIFVPNQAAIFIALPMTIINFLAAGAFLHRLANRLAEAQMLRSR